MLDIFVGFGALYLLVALLALTARSREEEWVAQDREELRIRNERNAALAEIKQDTGLGYGEELWQQGERLRRGG